MSGKALNLLASVAFTLAPPVSAQSGGAGIGQVDQNSTAPGPEQKEDQAATVQTAEQALQQDAQEYARLVGVSADEAQQRLRALKDLGPVKARLAQTYGSRLAGISIQHKPQLQVIVLLTGDAAVATENVNAGGSTVPVVFRTGARSTIAQLRDAITKNAKAIRGLIPATQGIGISSSTGELVVSVNAVGAAATTVLARKAELETLTGVPVRIRAIEGVDANSDVRGGSRLEGVNPTDGKRYFCTSGFVVKDTSGRTGVATAAHCVDNETYYNPNGTSIPLTFITQDGYGSRDTQIHTSSYTQRPEFYVDTDKTQVRRPVGSYALSATWEGDYACHRGEASGASCSFVEQLYYAPPNNLCGGYCEATYVTVTGPNCKGGDSGGPVYDQDLARGTVKGENYNTSSGTCNFYYYMPVEFLPDGWSLLLG